MQRPTGITILALLGFLGAAGCLILALIFLLAAGAVSAGVGPHASQGLVGFLVGLGAALGIILLALAALYLAAALGLWKLRTWGRLVAVALTSLGLLLPLMLLITALAALEPYSIALSLMVVAIQLWVLWYLFRAHVRTAFGGS
ncbi:MAG: hypothetical protein ACE5HB_02510 [Terriglobia bacterium]